MTGRLQLGAPEEVGWESLSDDAARIVVEIAVPKYEGYSYGEIAERLGRSPGWVMTQMTKLRHEIRATADRS